PAGEHLDEAAREHVEPVGLRDVAVQRRRVELCQHEDLLEPRVQTVADRNIDEAVLAADRDGRLRSHVREREEPRAASSAEDQCEHVLHADDFNELVISASWRRYLRMRRYGHRWPAAGGRFPHGVETNRERMFRGESRAIPGRSPGAGRSAYPAELVLPGAEPRASPSRYTMSGCRFA